MIVGVLHPGAMGGSLLADASGELMWAGDGRSPETHARAVAAGAFDVGSLDQLCQRADVIVSVCPPGAALALAEQVHATAFDGVYCDANAVSPETAKKIDRLFERFVDGGIVGPPVSSPTSTRLYLSGPEASLVARPWADGNLEVRVIGNEPGQASALKMAYAGWTKGSGALLLAMRALARTEGIEDALLQEWSISQPDLAARTEAVAAFAGPKGWRFTGEMLEISTTLEAAGLPPGFHQGAADVWQRLAPLKGTQKPTLDAAMDLICNPEG